MTKAYTSLWPVDKKTGETSHIDDLNMQKLAECEESIDSLKWIIACEIRNILRLEGRLNTPKGEIRRQKLLKKSLDLLNAFSEPDIIGQLIQKHTKSTILLH